VTAALGMASFSTVGLYCNHADLSPRYAPFLLGMTNTLAALPGIVGVAVTGAILDQTGSKCSPKCVPPPCCSLFLQHYSSLDGEASLNRLCARPSHPASGVMS
jgi:ACS family sodium-dependent inorganic phosphate cotransporter